MLAGPEKTIGTKVDNVAIEEGHDRDVVKIVGAETTGSDSEAIELIKEGLRPRL